MKVKLTVTSGPQAGAEFEYDGHATLLVGRSKDAHLRMPDDPYFSRRHFLVEVNPPRCRLRDLKSRNGVSVNGVRLGAEPADVADGDVISAGHTKLKVQLVGAEPDAVPTLNLPASPVPPPPAVVSPSKTGPVVPGFTVGPELGRGGMGVVYRAVREEDGLPVALKVVATADGATVKQIERFLRECRILAELDHPNVVAFREAGRAAKVVFLAMDLVDGPNLATVLKQKGPLDVRAAVRVTSQVLSGLAHAHARRFVHRDVKPSNVLIGRAGAKRVAKLADFGLSRVYEETRLSGITMYGETGGTPAFMAPESVTHLLDAQPAGDQYSTAATLYTLLTGRHTHDFPTNPIAQITHLLTEDPVPIAARRPDLPAGLAAVVHKALRREPGDRYPDVTAFQKALAKFG